MEFYLVVSEIKENKSDQSNLKFYKFLKKLMIENFTYAKPKNCVEKAQ